jgi:hypothetical protein
MRTHATHEFPGRIRASGAGHLARPSGPVRSRRRGFALPTAIFALVVVALLVTSGFYIAGQERRIGQSTAFAQNATLLAETGMNEVLATWSPAEGQPTEGGAPLSVCTACTGASGALNGGWQVGVSRLGEKLYLIQSTGTVNDAGLLSGASRTVATLARLLTADFEAEGALLTRGNVETRGGASISGMDVHPPGAVCMGDLEDQTGVVTSSGSTVTSKGTSTVEGDPRDARHDTPSGESLLRFGSLTYDDLVLLADKTLPGGNLNNMGPSFNGDESCNEGDDWNWGDPEKTGAFDTCENYFPIIHVQGNARIQSGGVGQGVLLVDGNLDMRGNFLFQGVVLVKGQVEVQGAGNRVFGAVVADNGLEIDPDLSTFVGASVVQYSSCAIANTLTNLSSLTALRPVDNRSWVDLTLTGF